MMNYQKSEENIAEERVNLRFITMAVVIIVIMLTVIYSFQQYVAAKKHIIRSITTEANRLEKILLEELDEATYLFSVMVRQLSQAESDKDVANLFKSYVQDQDLKQIFSVANVVWVNKSGLAVADYKTGIYSTSTNQKNDINIDRSRRFPGKIVYGTSTNKRGEKTLVGTISIFDPLTQEYLGSLQAYFSITILRQRLYARTKHNYTSFAIIDLDNQILMQSDYILDKYWGIKEGMRAPKKILDISQSMKLSDKKSYTSYLNSVTGQNYCVMQLSIPSFLLVVSADPEVMKHKVIKKVWFKFMETSAVSFGFLLLIIAIYRREAMLRRKIEEAYQTVLKASRDKSDFLAYTAHEIRSPLGFILTGSEMMKNQLLGPVSKEYQEYVSGINSNAQAILDFMTDILDEDQIIGGNFKICNEVVNLSSLIRRVIRTHKARFVKRKMVFRQKMPQGLPLVICDLRRMTQVLNNLMSNAIKYSEEDTVVTVELKVYNDYELMLSITDEGIGMSTEEINVVLAKYGAVRKRETNFIESYGLGLAIVKVILDAHNFKIDISSETNKGTRVNIIIPKHRLIYSSKVE